MPGSERLDFGNNLELNDGTLLKEGKVIDEIKEEEGCPVCGQVDEGQFGEYPCPICGLPMQWDEK